MVVVVQHGVGECLRHVSDVLGLCQEVQHPVLDVLDDVWYAVRTMEVHVALLFADERFVTQRLEKFPCPDQVLDDVDVGTRFDVKVTGIEVPPYVQSRNQF